MREFSIYRGVSFDESNGKWAAKWGEDHLGYYKEEGNAAKAVKKYVKQLTNQ